MPTASDIDKANKAEMERRKSLPKGYTTPTPEPNVLPEAKAARKKAFKKPPDGDVRVDGGTRRHFNGGFIKGR